MNNSVSGRCSFYRRKIVVVARKTFDLVKLSTHDFGGWDLLQLSLLDLRKVIRALNFMLINDATIDSLIAMRALNKQLLVSLAVEPSSLP